jgi:hypothetical protein
MAEMRRITEAEYMKKNGIKPKMTKGFPAVKAMMNKNSVKSVNEIAEPLEKKIIASLPMTHLEVSESDKSFGCVKSTFTLQLATDDVKENALKSVNSQSNDDAPVYESVTMTSRLLYEDGSTEIPFSYSDPITKSNVTLTSVPFQTRNVKLLSGLEGFLDVTVACEKKSGVDYFELKQPVSLSETITTFLVEPKYSEITKPVSQSDVTKSDLNQIKLMYARVDQDTKHHNQLTDYGYETNNKSGDMKLMLPLKFSIMLAKGVNPRKDSAGNTKLLATVDEIKTLGKFGDDFKLARPAVYDIDVGLQTPLLKHHYDNYYKDSPDQDYLDKGLAQCVSAGTKEVTGQTFNTINVDFAINADNSDDWFANIGRGVNNNNTTSTLIATFKFAVTDANGDLKILTILIQSFSLAQFTAAGAQPNYNTLVSGGTNQFNFYIPPIYIWWGCFADDVKITMANGGVKRADEICVGDIVKTADGRSATVGNVYAGTDEDIYVIITEDDIVLRVSGNHPMCTNIYENTFRAAQDFNPGDKLIGEDGSEKIIRHIDKVPYGKKVYNFAFEEHPIEGCAILGNGIWSGDLIAQNTCERKAFEEALEKRDQATPTDYAAQLSELLKAAAKANK